MGGYCAPAFGRLISHRTFYGLHYMRRTAGQRLRTQRHPMGRLTKYAYPPPVSGDPVYPYPIPPPTSSCPQPSHGMR